MPQPTRIALESDRIANMIFHADLEWIDIEIMIEALREKVATEFPDKLELFEHLHVSRFRRLWRDWSGPLEGDEWWLPSTDLR